MSDFPNDLSEPSRDRRITRKRLLIGAAAGLPLAGALVADAIRPLPPRGHHTEAHLFDGTKSSRAFRQHWPAEAVKAAEFVLLARDRFRAGVFTSSLGSVDWQIDVDGSDVPKKETRREEDDSLRQRARHLRPQLTRMIYSKASHGSDPFAALEDASHLPRLTAVRIWSDMITDTPDFDFSKLAPQKELARFKRLYAHRLGALRDVQVVVIHGGRGVRSDVVVRQSEDLAHAILRDEVGAKLEWIPSLNA